MEVFRFCNNDVRQGIWAEGLKSEGARPMGSSTDWGVPPDQGGFPDWGSKRLAKNFHYACIGLAQGI